MSLPLHISTVTLTPADRPTKIFDMSTRCAFVLCTKGRISFKVMNTVYHMEQNSIFACMPFITIELLEVIEPCTLIFGYIEVQHVPTTINRWVDTNNLFAIQNRPLISISEEQSRHLCQLIDLYLYDSATSGTGSAESMYARIQSDINAMQSQLIVAHVVKMYFADLQITTRGHSHRDLVFQRFILDLYANCRTHRSVQFYAERSGTSLKYFSTLVRELTGSTPSSWIETVVVAEAKSLLRDYHLSIKDIATAMNFPDAPTFTKYFRRITGSTPKAYRKSVP